MIIGTVAKHQVRMVMTFDEDEGQMLGHALADALEDAYKNWQFFQFEPEYDPDEEF